MKIEEMKELIQAVSDSEVDEFKYSDEKCSVRIMKNKTQVVAAEAVPAAAAAPRAFSLRCLSPFTRSLFLFSSIDSK